MKKNYSSVEYILSAFTEQKPCKISTPDCYLKKFNFLLVFTLFLLIFSTQNSKAQTDTCGTPTTITAGTSCTTTNFDITGFNNDGPVACSGTSYRDGWFQFTTDATTTQITIIGTSNRELGLGIYTGSTCGSLTQVACTVPVTSGATLNATVLPNTTYKLRLMRTNNNNTNSMTGTICVQKLTGCTNATQFPTAAITAPAPGATTTISTAQYQDEYNAISGMTNGNTYVFTNSLGGYITIHSGTYNGTVVANGNSPLSYTPSATGTYYVHYNTNSSCGTATTGGTTTINCILPACNGTTTAGTVTTTPSSNTPGTNYTVSATGYTVATGLTFQWQSNTNSTGWIDAGGSSSTYSNYNATAPAIIGTIVQWRLVVTCTSSSGTANSSTGTFTTSATAAYCTPTGGSSSTSYYLTPITTTGGITNINYTAGSYNAYVNNSGTQFSQYAGNTVNVNLGAAGGSTYYFYCWVDWNQDGDFTDTGETIFSTTTYTATHAGMISIPAGQASGTYRVRFGLSYMSAITSCGPAPYGNYVDYTLNVPTPPLCTGTPSAGSVAVTPTGSTPGSSYTVSASGFTLASSMTYQWQSNTNSAGWVNVGTATSSYSAYTATAPAVIGTIIQWRLIITCTVTSQSATSSTGTFTVNSIPNPCPGVPGNGTGTTTLGCPNVVAGGAGLAIGTPPAAINTCTGSGSATIEATYLQLGNTTNYTVTSIPYSPPYQYCSLANPVGLTGDDYWSPVVNLPFNFCFYGNNYNQCVVGTNGMISFDPSLAGNASGYAFSNNLPSTVGALFPNCIYGVYQDTDISKGGEIGWELITLNTGCRALVVSSYNVPLFGDNTKLYTGMMVLYENTNVIEVYIKSKPLDDTDGSPFNGNNAIVGVQNAAGTAAVVAPGRNGLDTDWAVTNEAWRFTPSGASITTLAWYEGNSAIGPVLGTNYQLTVSPAATTNYTAQITYTLCDGRTIQEASTTTVTVNGTKTWNGSVNTDWNTANNWTPTGVPTASECVVIPTAPNNAIVSGTNYNGVAHKLTVQNGGNLSISTPTTPNRTSLTITDVINVNTGGIFTVNNSANLIQTNNVANTGNINMLRNAFVDFRDYVYWSSPVAAFNSANISTFSNNSYLYKWTPTVAGNGTGNFGNWYNGTETMVVGKGYIERGLNNAPLNSPVTFTATFTGVPNNGNITTPISRGTYNTVSSYTSPYSPTNASQDDDNWNLIGNPYPSSIDAKAFLTANAANLDGFIKIWTHGIAPSTAASDPFYNNYGYNYDPTDYLTYNLSGAQTQNGFDGYIGAGQSFITKMLHSSASTSANAVFNNTMRSNTFRNDQFYKNSNNNSSTYPEGRIWLDLVSPTASNSTLVAYVDGATNNKDQMYDAQADLKATFSIYSLLDGYDRNIIQGRSLPFDQNDQVPLAVKLPTTGSYTIAIQGVDGLFSNQSQNIYLEDKQLNLIHDLRSAPYPFTGAQGEIIDRFVLRYTNQTLSNSTFDYNNAVSIFTDNSINVKSSVEKIKEITVYDVLGKTLVTKKKVNNTEISITEVRPTTNVLIVKVKLENDAEVVKKVIY